jgi:hypothetical protein
MKKKAPMLYKFISLYFVFALFLNYNSTSALPKIVGMLTIAIAVCCFLYNADIDYAKNVFSTSFPFYLQIIYLLALSCIIWIVSVQTMPYMMPGFTRLLYTAINITVAVCSAYIFGKDCIEFAFWGSIIYHIKMILIAAKAAGISNIVPDFINTIMGGDTGVFMGTLEVNEPTFCIGIFLLFFIFCDKEMFGKRKYLYIVLSIIFLMTGFKRNIVGAVALGIAIGIVMRKMKSRGKDLNVAIFIGIFAIIACMIYIYLIKSSIFITVLQEYGVNLMSREGLYEFIGDQYEFSPFFIGRGFGFVEHYLVYVKTLGLKYAGSSLEHIHNDLLLYYIEEGFWGYLGWLFMICIWYPIWWYKHGNSELCLIYTVFNAYNLITFTTDNMSSSYQVTLTYRLILMGCFVTYYLKKEDHEKERGNEVIKIQHNCSSLQ